MLYLKKWDPVLNGAKSLQYLKFLLHKTFCLYVKCTAINENQIMLTNL